jgi:hypothetical protein
LFEKVAEVYEIFVELNLAMSYDFHDFNIYDNSVEVFLKEFYDDEECTEKFIFDIEFLEMDTIDIKEKLLKEADEKIRAIAAAKRKAKLARIANLEKQIETLYRQNSKNQRRRL